MGISMGRLKNARRKSYKQETALVDLLQETGFAAEKIRDQEGRAKDTTESGDVSVPLCGRDYTIECKHHKDGFQKVYAAIEGADIAVIKQNHKRDSLVIVRLSTWLEHIKLAESYRASWRAGATIQFTDAAE